MRKQRAVSTSRVIAAERQALFDIVADPGMHPVIDGSGSVRAATGDVSERLELDATFGMDMKLGSNYHIENRVVEFEEGQRIAWRHFHGHRWRYEFEDVEGGTRVTETFDWSRARSKLAIELARFPTRNLRGMEATLERLDELATTGEVADAS